jgi:hypothetical protein
MIKTMIIANWQLKVLALIFSVILWAYVGLHRASNTNVTPPTPPVQQQPALPQ